jgi:hypothetical protein
MAMRSVSALVTLALVVLLAAPGAAAAGPSVRCEPAEDDVIDVDGLVDDWRGVTPARTGTEAEASFDVRCLVTGAVVWLAVEVRDDRVTRGSAADDRLDLTVGAGKPLRLALWPGVDKHAPRRTLAGKAAPRWLAIEDSLTERGWAVELAIPLAKLPGHGSGTAALPLAVTLADGDIPKGKVHERTVAWTGELGFAGKADALASFLAAAGVGAGDVTLDQQADVDPTRPGRERVVAAGDRLALLTDQFAFVALPVRRPTDVIKVELVDLRGDGSQVIAARLRQRSGDGVRDLVTLWTAQGGQLAPIGNFEIGRERDGRRLVSTWKVVAGKPWSKRTGGAKRVIEIRAQAAVGWDEDSYREATASDAEPIHVPWDDDRVGGLLWLKPDGNLDALPLAR